MIYLILTWLCWPFVVLFRRPTPLVPQRILIIQRAKIGDVICSTPVFKNLRTQFPAAEIDILAGSAALDLLRVNPHLNMLHVWTDAELAGWRGKWRLVRMMRERRYDMAICLNVGLVYPLSCFWSGIPLRYAVRPNFLGTTYRLACGLWTATEFHDGRHLIGETYAALLKRAGVTETDSLKEMFARPNALSKAEAFMSASRHPRIGIGVGAGNKLKALGPEMLGGILAGLFDKHPGGAVVLIGTKADRELAAQLVARFPEMAITNACGEFELGEMPALLQLLDVYLGVDSGITYMADALGIPLVSVAGPCNMLETRPTGPQVVVMQKFPPCAPCAHIFRAPYSCATGDLACLRTIEPDEVVRVLCGLINDSSRDIHHEH